MESEILNTATNDAAATAATNDVSIKPDRTEHDTVKARYKMLQLKYADLAADKAILLQELEAATKKRDKLQAEADMLIEQLQGASSERQPISLEVDYVDAPTAEEEEYYLDVIQPQALAVAARAPNVEADGRQP